MIAAARAPVSSRYPPPTSQRTGDGQCIPMRSTSTARSFFPSNCFPDLDFSTLDSLEQLDAVVRRDFDSKAPGGNDILEGIKSGTYQDKFELMRDMALNLFWANRFKMTMYDVQPTRWADVPRTRDDIFVPILTPWEDRETKVTAVQDSLSRIFRRNGTPGSRTASSRSSSTCSAIAATTPPNCPRSSPRWPI